MDSRPLVLSRVDPEILNRRTGGQNGRSHNGAATLHDAESLESLEPLDRPLAPPALPLDALPPAHAAYAERAARAIGCPTDFVVIALLVALAAAIGNRAVLAIKPGMIAKSILFAFAIGMPGTGKTPAAEAAFVEHRRRHNELAKSFAEEMETWTSTPKNGRGPEPWMGRVMVDDATLEALSHELVTSNGLLNYRGELASWIFGLSRYRRDGSDRPDWLKLWNGQPIDQARVSRGPTYAPDPHLCLFAETQPDRVKLLTAEVGNDGLMDRFFGVWPDAEPAPWSDDPMPDPKPLREAVARLRALPDAPVGGSWTVRLAPEAYAAYRAWHDTVNLVALREGTGAGAGWAAKAPMPLQRLALVLHLAWDAAPTGTPPSAILTAATMERAIDLIEAIRLHMARVVVATDAGTTAAPRARPLPDRVLGLLRRKGGWLSADAVVRGIGNASAAEVHAALADLVAAGSVETRAIKTATKPGREWRAVTHDDAGPERDSRNSRDSQNPRIHAEIRPLDHSRKPNLSNSRDSRDLGSGEFLESLEFEESELLEPRHGDNSAPLQTDSEFLESLEPSNGVHGETAPPPPTCLSCSRPLPPGRRHVCADCEVPL